MDVKYVPTSCYVGEYADKFYQYTVIDECTRERYIYHYKEQSSHSTVNFLMRAIKYFKYKPQIVQTDNGFEFTHFKETKMVHPLDIFCEKLGIRHQLIRPRTPRHNGRVERSHRNDNERFYKRLSFYSYEDLIVQAKAYIKRANNIPMQTLGVLTPLEKRAQYVK
ncbi:hypothetical protein FACS189481_3160 [Clostridia bacterium]|nr:hypothetical protein FACS189481_3160 [Clostridia bacterium]